MLASNLLNLNVDALFEQHSVAEIEIVRKKIQAVVEEKKEDLRTMVGERYRDLLKAADAIASMQESSDALITQMGGITGNCRKFNEQQLIGFKTNDDVTDALRSRKENKELNNCFSTMVQIKLLTALPELIWSHIDREELYVATELFVFSRHISTGLQLDASNPFMQRLPVAKRQWEVLKPFHVTIKQHVMRVLESDELSIVKAVDGLLSLILLENNNLNEVFKIFLQLRSAAFLNCFIESERGNNAQRRRVKERILDSLKVLNGTIDLIEKCFIDNSVLIEKLATLSEEKVSPTICRMDCADSRFAYLLPEIISKFRPKFATQPLEDAQLRTALEQWLTDIRHISGAPLKNAFELISTMGQIKEIKNEANSCRKYLNFVTIANRLKLTQTLDFYELKYVPLINKRVHDIIQHSWKHAMEETFDELERLLQKTAFATEESFWIEHTSDLPLSLEESLSDGDCMNKLLMKIKGYDDLIIELSTEFDRKLANIVSEMNVLMEEQTTKVDDKLVLLQFLRDTAQLQLTKFVAKVKGLKFTSSHRSELLLVVRTCVALVELSPHLKICFCYQSNWKQSLGDKVPTNTVEHWSHICQMLEDEMFVLWQTILNGILEEHPFRECMPHEIIHDIMLEDFTHWETVILDQIDEQDNLIHSKLRIPTQPRVSLQSYIFTLIRMLNATIPQTIPAKVLKAFNVKLLQQIISHYQTWSSHKSTVAGAQNVALQLYYDLRFLQNAFIIVHLDVELNEQYASLQNYFKDIIDPFDFELFAEHIVTNVEHAVLRLTSEFGVLVPQLSPVLMATVSSLVQDKDPNILSISSSGSTSLWFPLLPIITTDTSGAMERKGIAPQVNEKQITPIRKSTTALQQHRKVDLSTTTTAATTNTVTKSKSGAASFFGAMSQEWFR